MTETITKFGPAEFQAEADVSRETLANLIKYASLLIEWQDRLNLVGPSTLPDLWWRHMWDSAQVLRHIAEPQGKTWADFGTGAGFPGIVLALMGVGEVHLVEKSPKKCLFLRAVAAGTGAPIIIHEKRAEELRLPPIDIILSRACAPLRRLLDMTYPFFEKTTEAYFHKGQNLEAELSETTKSWKMETETFPSLTDDRGRILRVRGLRRV